MLSSIIAVVFVMMGVGLMIGAVLPEAEPRKSTKTRSTVLPKSVGAFWSYIGVQALLMYDYRIHAWPARLASLVIALVLYAGASYFERWLRRRNSPREGHRPNLHANS